MLFLLTHWNITFLPKERRLWILVSKVVTQPQYTFPLYMQTAGGVNNVGLSTSTLWRSDIWNDKRRSVYFLLNNNKHICNSLKSTLGTNLDAARPGNPLDAGKRFMVRNIPLLRPAIAAMTVFKTLKSKPMSSLKNTNTIAERFKHITKHDSCKIL